MHLTTVFMILAEFGQAHIPITQVGNKYFGYDEKKAKVEATKNGYPFPVFRAGGQKSTWVVDAQVLANYLDKQKEKANKEFKAVKNLEQTIE